MKAITIQQPWAWAVIHGGKDIENRTRIGTWRSAIGQRIAVHAGKRWSDRGGESDLIRSAMLSWLNAQQRAAGWVDPAEHPDRFQFGAIIGTVRVVDVHPTEECCQPWGESSYRQADGTLRQGYLDIAHLVLAEPRPCDPTPCRGALGLWTVPADIAAELSALVVQEDRP